MSNRDVVVVAGARTAQLAGVEPLARVGKRYSVITMCIGGGQGIAAVFERL